MKKKKKIIINNKKNKSITINNNPIKLLLNNNWRIISKNLFSVEFYGKTIQHYFKNEYIWLESVQILLNKDYSFLINKKIIPKYIKVFNKLKNIQNNNKKNIVLYKLLKDTIKFIKSRKENLLIKNKNNLIGKINKNLLTKMKEDLIIFYFTLEFMNQTNFNSIIKTYETVNDLIINNSKIIIFFQELNDIYYNMINNIIKRENKNKRVNIVFAHNNNHNSKNKNSKKNINELNCKQKSTGILIIYDDLLKKPKKRKISEFNTFSIFIPDYNLYLISIHLTSVFALFEKDKKINNKKKLIEKTIKNYKIKNKYILMGGDFNRLLTINTNYKWNSDYVSVFYPKKHTGLPLLAQNKINSKYPGIDGFISYNNFKGKLKILNEKLNIQFKYNTNNGSAIIKYNGTNINEGIKKWIKYFLVYNIPKKKNITGSDHISIELLN